MGLVGSPWEDLSALSEHASGGDVGLAERLGERPIGTASEARSPGIRSPDSKLSDAMLEVARSSTAELIINS